MLGILIPGALPHASLERNLKCCFDRCGGGDKYTVSMKTVSANQRTQNKRLRVTFFKVGRKKHFDWIAQSFFLITAKPRLPEEG